YAPTGIYAQRINGQGNTPPTGTGQNPPAPLSARNYPNPFNPSTTIAFALPEAGHVDLRIYDIAGRLVRILLSERRDAGRHEVAWDGTDDKGSIVASGVYFYSLAGNDQIRTRKMVLLR
ncbi:MAG: T9SS type A sorting domain-containing protein, partial [Candidatus Krumholzibacteria bacterium]|nr:T9SS type A sorting domain-containing protein [Candidatus Krumholzibacteria bacterium]